MINVFCKCFISLLLAATTLVSAAPLVEQNKRDVHLEGSTQILTGFSAKINIAASTNIIWLPNGAPSTVTVVPTTTVTAATTTITSTAATTTILQTVTSAVTTTVLSQASQAVFSSIPQTSSSPSKPAASASASVAPSTGSSSPSGAINAVYYPDWIAGSLPPSAVDYTLFDVIYFSFAIPDNNLGLYFTQDNSISILRDLVTRTHAAGKRVCITIGGWTGSQYFSNSVSSDANRQTFASNIAKMVSLYGVDGVDLDWEYPGQAGASGNIITNNDSANLLLFLQVLRQKLGSSSIISLATPLNVWYGNNGQPMKDVSQYAQYIDHVLLMNYDVWGATNAPNAPLSVCDVKTSSQPYANAQGGVAAWKAAGMPANKIMLGIASYGYVASSSATTLNHRRRSLFNVMEVAREKAMKTRSQQVLSNARLIHSRLARERIQERGVNLASYAGSSIEFSAIMDSGALAYSATAGWSGQNGYTQSWDTCSQTPYLYNTDASIVVTYDDTKSLQLKGNFAAQQGLRGLGMWDISGDTDSWILTKAARAGLGLSS